MPEQKDIRCSGTVPLSERLATTTCVYQVTHPARDSALPETEVPCGILYRCNQGRQP